MNSTHPTSLKRKWQDDTESEDEFQDEALDVDMDDEDTDEEDEDTPDLLEVYIGDYVTKASSVLKSSIEMMSLLVSGFKELQALCCPQSSSQTWLKESLIKKELELNSLFEKLSSICNLEQVMQDLCLKTKPTSGGRS